MIFRRIHGHIVALNISDENRERAKGAALGASGVAVGLSAATASSHIVNRAIRSEMQEARTGARAANHFVRKAKFTVQPQFAYFSPPDYKKLAKKNLDLADKLKATSSKLYSRSFKVKQAGALASAALLGIGTNKVLDQTRLKDHSEAKAAINVGVTSAATFAVHQTFKSKMANLKGMKLVKDVAVAGIKKAAKFAVRRL